EAERRMNGQNITGNGDAHLDGALEHYSFVRAVAGAAGLAVDDGLEREIDTELKKKSGRPFEGRAVPLSVLTHAPRTHGMNRAQRRREFQYEQRVVTTAARGGGPGGNLISTDYRPDAKIDILRPASVVYRMGATLLTGLVGNVAIPALTKSTGFAWVAENAAITPSDPETLQVTLAPKHGGGITE